MTAPLSPVTLLVREECALCAEFLLSLALDFPAAYALLRTTDVDAHPALALAFGLRVPVLCLGTEVLCEGRYDRARVAAGLGL